MAEFAGLGYYAEIPGVIFDIQRTGPSTGLPTRTSQADLTFVRDSRMAIQACDSAAGVSEGVLRVRDGGVRPGGATADADLRASDLDLGMNNWMSEPFEYPEKPMQRGKVLDAKQLEKLGGFARYKDVDGDAIPYRTLPGTDHPAAAYFTRGSGTTRRRLLGAAGGLREQHGAAGAEVRDREDAGAEACEAGTGKERVGIIAYGSSHWAVIESREQLEHEAEIATDY